MIDICKKIIK